MINPSQMQIIISFPNEDSLLISMWNAIDVASPK
jgi:hypothetical protein